MRPAAYEVIGKNLLPAKPNETSLEVKHATKIPQKNTLHFLQWHWPFIKSCLTLANLHSRV